MIVTSSPGRSFFPHQSCNTALPPSSVSYNATVSSPEAWLAISTQGTITWPEPGKSSALERYIASTIFQSSKLSRPVSSSHHSRLHQEIDWVAFRIRSNSDSRTASLASTASFKDVPYNNTCSTSVQSVGNRVSLGKNLMYSDHGFVTPILECVPLS